MEERIFSQVITVGDVIDSNVMRIIKGTDTERKGNAVMRLIFIPLPTTEMFLERSPIGCVASIYMD